MFKLFKKTKRGFTLLELIVVIVVIGILAAIAIPSYSAVIARANTKSAEVTGLAVVRDAKAITAFTSSTAAQLPLTLTNLNTAVGEAGLTAGSETTGVYTFSANSKSVSINMSTGVVTVSSSSTAPAGIYALGDTGPGGGKVFYVDNAGFTCGPTLNLTCKYLEAAPTTGTNAWTDATYTWSGTTGTAIGAPAQGTAIGTGYQNTLAMVAQTSGGDTANRAGTISRAYRGPNNLTDWFLPSKDELNELYTQKTTVGGFVENYYWSSTELGTNYAWFQEFYYGLQGGIDKYNTLYVRPVRAF